MIVIADTSPINYLILIEVIEIFTKIYGKVVIPRSVRQELLRPSALEAVRKWMAEPPAWLELRIPANALDASLTSLDPGERDAILLAAELDADQLIVDDRQGRQAAQRRGISVIGTLGVLRVAGNLGLLDFGNALKRLEGTNFRIGSEVLARLLKGPH
jgi:predicted nucleic acid-binding protein